MYLCKCEDTYFVFQNKYLCINKDNNLGAKILRADDYALKLDSV